MSPMPPDAHSGLALDRLVVRYPDAEVPAVQGVSLGVPAGSVTAVLGPSGCGKSTLLRAVAGLEVPESGTVAFAGTDLVGTPTHRRGFALMFQDGQLFGHLDVAGNVGYALRLARTPRRDRVARVAELLELVGLGGFEKRPVATLSGGQRQRVALARALAGRPRLVLLDEPLTALDASLRERLAADVREILRAEGATGLLVTHDHDEAYAVADRVALLREGRLVQEGEPAAVWARPGSVWAAEFLGYPVLAGPAARALVPAGEGPVALRPGALRVASADDGSAGDGSGPVGRVVGLRRSPSGDRVTVVLGGDDGARCDAAVPDPLRVPASGEQVRLAVDLARVVELPDP